MSVSGSAGFVVRFSANGMFCLNFSFSSDFLFFPKNASTTLREKVRKEKSLPRGRADPSSRALFPHICYRGKGCSWG